MNSTQVPTVTAPPPAGPEFAPIAVVQFLTAPTPPGGIIAGPFASPYVAPAAVQPGTIMAIVSIVAIGIVFAVIGWLYRRNYRLQEERRRRFAEATATIAEDEINVIGANAAMRRANSIQEAGASPTAMTAMTQRPPAVGSHARQPTEQTPTTSPRGALSVTATPAHAAASTMVVSRSLDLTTLNNVPLSQAPKMVGGTSRGRAATINPLTHQGGQSAAALYAAAHPSAENFDSDELGPGRLPASVFHQWGGFASHNGTTTLGGALHDPMYDDEL